MESRKYRLISVLALLFFILLCGSAFLNYKLATYIEEYDEQFEKQDSMIQRLTFSNDLVKEYFDIEEDSITHTTTYSLKEEKRDKEVTHVTEYVEPVFDKDGKKMSSDELVTSINTNDYASVEAIKKLVEDYNSLVHDYNELARNSHAVRDTLAIQGSALKLIKRNYDIDYVSEMDGDMRIVKLIANKADSAFILLPYYRHKLSYDPNTDKWIVEYEKKVRK